MRCDEAIDALALLANCPLKEGRQQASRQTPILHNRGRRCSVGGPVPAVPLAVSIRYPSCRRGSEGWRVSSEMFSFGVEMYKLRGSGALVEVHMRFSCKCLVAGGRITTWRTYVTIVFGN